MRMLIPTLLLALAAALPASAADDLVRLETDEGNIVVKLDPSLAPKHVENFRKLAREGFYDGTTFHRAIPGYILQGGSPTSKDADPKNDNFGGPGYVLDPEFNTAVHDRGVVSMARNVDDPRSAGSQFFIVLGRAPQLDQIKFTVFGRVAEGLEVADRIAAAPRDAENFDRPLDPVVVRRARLLGVAGEAATPATRVAAGSATPAPAAEAPAAAPAGGRVRVKEDVVNVRKGPGPTEPVLQRIRKGTVLAVTGRRGDWVGVALSGGQAGWIRQDMLETVN